LILSDKQADRLLLVTEGVGAVFVAVFLAAYLGGLPTTAVLHSQATVKTLLSVFGALLLILISAMAILSATVKTINNL
jgi:hypothetical protein